MKRVFFAAAAVAALPLSSCSIASKYVLENASGSEIALLFRGAMMSHSVIVRRDDYPGRRKESIFLVMTGLTTFPFECRTRSALKSGCRPGLRRS